MYQQIIDAAEAENRLMSVLFELTYRCNLDCFYCVNNRERPGPPLSFEQYATIFRDLAEMQVLFITLSGGEPLAHPDFYRIGSLGKALGFVMRIKSNGHALDQRAARRIRSEIDPIRVDLSLHGACAESHDRQTQLPGSFERLMEHIPQMLDAGLSLRLNAQVTAWNEHELEGMYALADRLGVVLQAATDLAPRENRDLTPLTITPSQDGLFRSMRMISERANEANAKVPHPRQPTESPTADSSGERKICGAGSSTLRIDPYGNVFPCTRWPDPVGNLHTDPIRTVWYKSPPLLNVRELAVKANKIPRPLGPAGNEVAFCMALALNERNDPLAIYPSLERELAIRNRISSSRS